MTLKLRLSIFKSNKHIYCQIIDDLNHQTIASCSTLDNEIVNKFLTKKVNNMISSNLVGKKVGLILKKKFGNDVKLFYNNKYVYKGKIRALIEGIRSSEINI